MKKLLAAALILALSPWCAARADLNPLFTTFGTLDTEFGGDGIPNNAVAITTIVDGTKTITLGLTAHQRFGSPAVTNNGAGVFTAETGFFVPPPPSPSNLSQWNFAYYVQVEGGNIADYQFNLLYDFDPSIATDTTDFGNWDFNATLGGSAASTSLIEGSQNPGFAFLNNGFPPIIIPPTFAPFNALAAGQYTFALQAFTTAGGLLGQSRIQVNAVPEPSTLLGALGAISVVGFVSHRRKRTSREP